MLTVLSGVGTSGSSRSFRAGCLRLAVAVTGQPQGGGQSSAKALNRGLASQVLLE